VAHFSRQSRSISSRAKNGNTAIPDICCSVTCSRKSPGIAMRSFVKENLFTPPGHEGFRLRFQCFRNSAPGVGICVRQERFRERRLHPHEHPAGCGARLYSTTEDLLKWEQGLFGGRVLKAASLQKMTTPFKSNYAFGLQVQTAGRTQGDRPRRRHRRLQYGTGVLPRTDQADGSGVGQREWRCAGGTLPGNWRRWPTATR